MILFFDIFIVAWEGGFVEGCEGLQVKREFKVADKQGNPKKSVNLGQFAEQRLKELENQLGFLFEGANQEMPTISRKFLKDNMYLRFSFDTNSTERLCLKQWYKMPLKTGSCYLTILPQIARNIFVYNCAIKFNGCSDDRVRSEIINIKKVLLQYWGYSLFDITSVGVGNNKGEFTARIKLTGLYKDIKLEGYVSLEDLLAKVAKCGTEELTLI